MPASAKRRQRREGTYQENSPESRARRAEGRLIALIEGKGTIERYEKLIARVAKGSLDVPGFIKAVSLDAAVRVADLMETGENDKVRLEAAKDILDRAGYNKTAKIAIAGRLNVDHDTSKLELVNLILSAARRAGIKVKDEEPVFAALPAKGPEPVTIDVTLAQELEVEDSDPEED